MTNRKDLRYMKTERAIRRAFHELLQEKDMRRITVRELVERAEINKTTFYSHYETLPDLIDVLEKENINYIMNNLDQVQLLYEDSDQFIDNLYRNLRDCRIRLIGKNSAIDQHFLDWINKRLSEVIDSKRIDVGLYKRTTAMLIFILHGILGIMDYEENAEENISYIKEFVKKGLVS